MLDDRMRLMLETANTLTAEDLEFIRSDGAMRLVERKPAARKRTQKNSVPLAAAPVAVVEAFSAVPAAPAGMSTVPATPPVAANSRGEYERKRPRESKVSTECLGEERVRHDWWPLGTEIVGQIGSEFFTAVVVENPSVKSGRSLKITSGPAQGKICITPTRAAMEATEAYRQAHNLGRGGGVTNGWSFWQPRTGATV
jgi:hypothetical protein